MFFVALSMVCVVLFNHHIAAHQEGDYIEGSHAWSGTVAEIMQMQETHTAPQSSYLHHHHYRAMRKSIPLDEEKSTEHSVDSELKATRLSTVPISTLATTVAECHSFPPDTMGDVGPLQYIIACNGRIKTFSKTTGLPDNVLNVDLGVFLNSVTNNERVSDPRIRYDKMSNRWFIIAMTVSEPNRILLAMSDTGTITAHTQWHFFFFNQALVSPPGNSTCLGDYPTLGIDANGLYIGVNEFCVSTSGSTTLLNPHIDGSDDDAASDATVFGGTTAFVIQKAPLVNSKSLRVFAFRNLIDTHGNGPYTPQGVDNFDQNPAFGYIIGVNASTFSQLALITISNVTTTPFIAETTLINVPPTASPLPIPHQGNTGGTAGYLDSLDDRLMYAHIRNNHLWTCHNIGLNNTGTSTGTLTRTGCRWYEIDLAVHPPVVLQAGTVYTPSAANDTLQRNYWIPSLMTTGQGHMVLGCSSAGVNEFANAAFTTRLQNDALNTTQTPQLYTATTTAYNPSFDPGGANGRRWGDYSSTRLDPLDNMTVWTVQEYCNETNSYGVRLAKILAPAPASITSITPASIAHDTESVLLTIQGTSTNGTGFYDPGTGFIHRILARIDGGVTVTNVEYISPTELHLTVSTIGATIGSRTVTIINPDRQTVSVRGLLRVT